MRPTEYRAQLRRFLALTLLALGPLANPALSSPLFDDNSVLDDQAERSTQDAGQG